jgi:hypothetical protein
MMWKMRCNGLRIAAAFLSLAGASAQQARRLGVFFRTLFQIQVASAA